MISVLHLKSIDMRVQLYIFEYFVYYNILDILFRFYHIAGVVHSKNKIWRFYHTYHTMQSGFVKEFQNVTDRCQGMKPKS